jgi:hypothetical protein
VKDVGFFKDNKILPRRSTLRHLLLADQATIKITNQKNGRMGEKITHETIQNQSHGPVTALARGASHPIQRGAAKKLCSATTSMMTEIGRQSLHPK